MTTASIFPEASLLLTTKLHRPRPMASLVPRTRLLEALTSGLSRPLTLISAPAGYGKSTLASVWLAGLAGPAAWLSLDERDDDLLTFAGYLLAAARGALPAALFRTQSLLQAHVPPSASAIARSLAADLDHAGQRLVLALDDIHQLRDAAIYDLLAEMLRHPSPYLHLVLIGRRDPPLPVATLRAKGNVVEIRARDLRFTAPETTRLLALLLGHDVDEALAAQWTARTEGWVAGLRLVALSLGQQHDLDSLAADALESPQYVQEYLLADVLAHLPGDRRDWLLKASLLDRFSASLCDALCGADDDNARAGLTGKAFIRWLQDDNLFLVSLDTQGCWFRFHHLFRDLLRDLLAEQMGRSGRLALYRRASEWFAENGLLDEAIQYALAGSDAALAARLVEQGRYELMNSEQWTRLDRWLRLLPAETVANNILLTNAAGFLALQRDDEPAGVAALQRAKQLLSEMPPENEIAHIAQAELDVLPFLVELYAGRVADMLASARRSLQTLPPDALHIRSLALHSVALALHMSGAAEQALDTLNAALSDPTWPPLLRARLLHYISLECYLCGDLPGVLEHAAECLALTTGSERQALATWGLYYLGAAHYAGNAFDAAEPHLVALMENMDFGRPTALAFGAFALALIRLEQGRADEAAEVIKTLESYLRWIEHGLTAPLIDTFTAELALRQGMPTRRLRARQLERAARLPIWYFYAPQLTEIKLLLADGRAASLSAAQGKLALLEAALRQSGVIHCLIDVLALQSLVSCAQGREEAAFERLAEALQLAEPGGFIRSFVDLGAPMAELLARLQRRARPAVASSSSYLERVLAAFAPHLRASAPARPAPDGGLLEPLTEREMQLLRLLASDLSPSEIAGNLSLSPSTVRTHFRNIYAKLDAHSRYEALMRAKELRLI